jgi:formylglycine-generating enzyme
MKSRLFNLSAIAALVAFASCKSKGGLQDDGQLHGVAPGNVKAMAKPLGMVYVPQGTFHMGPSDEDISASLTARNRQVSINGFWMDATEITNNEYRQFVWWVRDSIAGTLMNMKKKAADGSEQLDWAKIKTIKWADRKTVETLDPMIITADNRIYGKKEMDPEKVKYQVEYFDLIEAAKMENKGKARSTYMVKYEQPIYPDTLVWMRDFSYSYNEPMTRRYFAHPAFGNYPVVGVNWKQAVAFCKWRSIHLLGSYNQKKGIASSGEFRLPSEAEWEYAARGGRSQSMFPWGNYYLRNRKGCLLANFKPGRGNYPEDGGFYTVRADAYWPNDYGLYCMSGNVAEWTGSYFHEGAGNFQHDMNPDMRFNAKDSDPPMMKRKSVRGGSWKDVSHFLQTGTRSFEYQDSAKSYIGFRCVIDLPSVGGRR